MNLPEWLRDFGFVGERRALALLGLALLMAFYLFLGLNSLLAAPEVAPYLLAMSALYLVCFFSIGAEWFWARWFVQGVAWSGVIESAFGMFAVLRMREDFPPEVLQLLLVFFGVLAGLHGIAGTTLLGPRIAEKYDARIDWRERWQLDEEGVLKIRRTVTRAATSLPMIIAFTLAPRQDQALVSLAALVLGVLGIAALLRGFTVGLVGLFASALALSAAGILGAGHLLLSPEAASPLLPATFVPAIPLVAAALLVSAFAPFVRPIALHLAHRE